VTGRRTHVMTVVDHAAPIGGAERLAVELACRIDATRYKSYLCATRTFSRPAFEAQLDEAGVEVLVLGRRSPRDVRAWRPLVRLLRTAPIDVVHAHMFTTNVWSAVIGRVCRVPTIITHEHTWSFRGQPLRRLLDREVVGRLSDAVLTVSREDRRRMIELEGLSPAKVRYIPIGLPQFESPSETKTRSFPAIPPGSPVVAAVGRLERQKRLDVLVRATAILAESHPSICVVLAGSGSQAGALAALARELNVHEHVLFPGRIDRGAVRELLAVADVAALSSDFEGSPLAVMEYMAAGKPVVATNVGGVPDLIDSDSGILIEPGDERALAVALARLLDDAELRRRMGAAAAARQRRHFSMDAFVGRIEDLYAELSSKTR
jgi:glycosyltransferase involved in cell wall biosynthesis